MGGRSPTQSRAEAILTSAAGGTSFIRRKNRLDVIRLPACGLAPVVTHAPEEPTQLRARDVRLIQSGDRGQTVSGKCGG